MGLALHFYCPSPTECVFILIIDNVQYYHHYNYQFLFIIILQEAVKPYNSKTACWVPDKEEGYLAADVKETKGDMCTVTTIKGEVGDRAFLDCANILVAT